MQARLRVWLYRRLEPLLPGGVPGGQRGDLLATLISDTGEIQDLVVRVAVPVGVSAFAWLAAALAAAALVPAAGLALAVTGFLGQAAIALRAGVAAVIWPGTAALRAGRLSPEALGVLVFLAIGAGSLLQNLPDAVSRLPVSLASLRRLTGIAGLPVPVAESAAAAARPPCSRPVTPRVVPGTPAPPPAAPARPGGAPLIALRGAVPARPGPAAGRPPLSGTDLILAPGRPVALAGPSGSGKTSLILALLRFTDFTAGDVTVDGTDIRDLPAAEVRRLMAWSPEQPRLFPSALGANLRLGAPQATDEQIICLLGELGLGPWLGQLEHGLDTVIAPWGHPVSGGSPWSAALTRSLVVQVTVPGSCLSFSPA